MMMKQEGDERMKKICRVDRLINSGAKVSDCQDLLTRILLPLSTKTLVSFKLVSKQFHYVISDNLFGIEHVRFHHKNKKSLAPTGLYFYSSFSNCPEIYSVSISDPARSIPSLSSLEFVGFLLDRQFKIVQSCNGLLLCSFFDNENSSDSCSSPPSRLYCVCNPTTQDFIMLPEFPPVESSSSSSSKSKKREEELCHPILTLAFNPLETHIYKVFGVRVVKQLARKCSCELLVYSSDEGGRVWRKVGCQFSIPVALKRIRHGVFHDGGKITWITERGFIHFDVEAEKVITKRATSLSTWEKIRFFGECIDGSLYLIKSRDYAGVNVNQLRPETLKWEHRRNLRPQDSIKNRHLDIVRENYLEFWKPEYCSDMYQILAVGNGGKQLILAIPGMVLRFCRESLGSWVLGQLPEQFAEDFSFGCVTSFQFVETLSPV